MSFIKSSTDNCSARKFNKSVIFDDEGEIEDYVIRSSEVEGTFRLASYVAEQILLTDTDLLPEDLDPEEEI